jgi:hypothetical protein
VVNPNTLFDDEDLAGMTTTDDLEAHEAAVLGDDEEWQPETPADSIEYDAPDVFEDEINIDPPPTTSREPGVPLALPTDPTIEEIHDEALAIKRDRIAYRSDSLSRSALGVALVAVIEAFNGKAGNTVELFDLLQYRGCSFGEAARIKDIYERLIKP